MDSTSVSLLERLRTPGAGEAWARFVGLYTPLLYHWARRFGLDSHDAGDLVQDVFATLVERLPEFVYDPARRFRGWLWTITANTFRERKRRAQRLTATEEQAATLSDTAETPDPAAEVAEEEYRRYLTARALQLMRADFQMATWQVFWEHVVNDRPAQEVADEFGVTIGAVYAAKTRVLGRLREELRGLLD
jgi:RNA polymerase sigma-70 factor (ECF subfamily)